MIRLTECENHSPLKSRSSVRPVGSGNFHTGSVLEIVNETLK